MSRAVVAFLGILLFLSCETQSPSEWAGQVLEPAEEGDTLRDPRALPAYQLPWEKKVEGKQDWTSAYREAHPQWYTITQPPSVPFRPMKEWEPMQATLIAYSDYVPSSADIRNPLVASGVQALRTGELWVVYSDDSARADLASRLSSAGVDASVLENQVKWFQMDNDAIWIMDFGPLAIVTQDSDPKVAFADFRYYYDRYLDDAVPTRLANLVGTSAYRAPFEYEGGNFQADGEEYCYFSERVYMYTGMSFDAVEKVQQDYFGCQHSVALKDINDDGTGHIDMFFKLCDKHTAVVGEYTTVDGGANEQRMADNVALLESLAYSDGSAGITVYRMPFPNPGYWQSEKIPRTYINSTFVGNEDGSLKINIWPIYTTDKDLEAEALAVWQEAMPTWEHVGVEVDELSTYSGAIHCVTRTIPALPLEKWVEDGTCVAGACQGDGYTGACLDAGDGFPGCWGPAWACLCDDCSDGDCAIPASCGNGSCDNGETCWTCAQDCPCAEGQLCGVMTQQCSSSECGNGTCEDGESCSSCAADCGCSGGLVCSMGACVSDPCGGITYEGCCDGSVSVYCEDGDLVRVDCGTSGCGWDSQSEYYDCSQSGSDPSGEFLFECRGNYDYPLGCSDRECGDNGGGFSCGTCEEGKECSPEGLCVEGCRPFCGTNECGDDGCGGTCGTCAEGVACVEGLCDDGCVPDCADRVCGDDGCGGTCGTCDEGTSCVDGVCEGEVCLPACGENVCGDDGCGGSCGTCEEGTTCLEGLCEAEGTPDDDSPEDQINPEKGDSGCSSSGSSGTSGALPLFSGLVLMLGWLRRKRENLQVR